MTPILTDIKLVYDKEKIEIISPLHESIDFIRKNEFLIALFFNYHLLMTREKGTNHYWNQWFNDKGGLFA